MSACPGRTLPSEREFFIDNLMVRVHFIIVMIRWTGLASWKFEFPFPEGVGFRVHGAGLTQPLEFPVSGGLAHKKQRGAGSGVGPLVASNQRRAREGQVP